MLIYDAVKAFEAVEKKRHQLEQKERELEKCLTMLSPKYKAEYVKATEEIRIQLDKYRRGD